MFDVCLVGEGAYPDAIGGVASWTHDHVRAHPELSFAVVSLGSDGDRGLPRRYGPLANATLERLTLDPERATPPPELAERLPEARVYHALCTGAAGAVAARAAQLRGRSFLLTEHGLAWKEAALGITGCIIKVARKSSPANAGAVRELARASYRQADAVTSVCAAGSVLQRREGAPSERLHLTPNAAPALGERPARTERLRIGFVGRVVAVKDVETFIRAAALVAGQFGGAEFVVIGPLDHQPDYVERCRELAASLGVGARLRFDGERGSEAVMRGLDVLVLTSVSEAQPRVALEAMAAGIPVVATDVGGCRELLHGLDPVDRAFGVAGVLTPIRSPRATADAILTLARDPERRARLGEAGRRRVEARYSPELVHAIWGRLYERSTGHGS